MRYIACLLLCCFFIEAASDIYYSRFFIQATAKGNTPHIAKDKALTKIVYKINRKVAKQYRQQVPVGSFLQGVVYEVFELSHSYEAVASFDGLSFKASLEQMIAHIDTQMKQWQTDDLTGQQRQELLYLIHFAKALAYYPSSHRAGYKQLSGQRKRLASYQRQFKAHITKHQPSHDNKQQSLAVVTGQQNSTNTPSTTIPQTPAMGKELNNSLAVVKPPPSKLQPLKPTAPTIGFKDGEIIVINIAYGDIEMFEDRAVQRSLKKLLPLYHLKHVYKKSEVILHIDRKMSNQKIGDKYYLVMVMQMKMYVHNRLLSSKQIEKRVIYSQKNSNEIEQSLTKQLLGVLLQETALAIRENG